MFFLHYLFISARYVVQYHESDPPEEFPSFLSFYALSGMQIFGRARKQTLFCHKQHKTFWNWTAYDKATPSFLPSLASILVAFFGFSTASWRKIARWSLSIWSDSVWKSHTFYFIIFTLSIRWEAILGYFAMLIFTFFRVNFNECWQFRWSPASPCCSTSTSSRRHSTRRFRIWDSCASSWTSWISRRLWPAW